MMNEPAGVGTGTDLTDKRAFGNRKWSAGSITFTIVTLGAVLTLCAILSVCSAFGLMGSIVYMMDSATYDRNYQQNYDGSQKYKDLDWKYQNRGFDCDDCECPYVNESMEENLYHWYEDESLMDQFEDGERVFPQGPDRPQLDEGGQGGGMHGGGQIIVPSPHSNVAPN